MFSAADVKENNLVRSSWRVMWASIVALMIRNIQKRFITNVHSKRSLTFLWIFLEPMMHIAIWLIIKMSYRIGGQTSLAMPLFILLGAVPWLLTSKMLQSSVNIISSNKNLLVFRQIRPIDFIISSLFAEVGVYALVVIIFLSLFYWYNIHWQINSFAYWLVNLFSYVMFVAGTMLIFSVGGFFFKFLGKFMTVLVRSLYFISGIFFSAEMIPVAYRDYLLLNPLFQIIEISRECFTQHPLHGVVVDPIYLFKCAVVSLALGLGIYVTFRNKMMVDIGQR